MNKDKIESAIVSEIAEHQNEITRLKEILNHYKYSMGGTSLEEKTPVKRKYVRSGKYAKKNNSTSFVKRKQKRKKLVGNLKIIKWRQLIFDALQQEGKPMTSKQIIARLFSGRHKSTLKVLKRKISVSLSIYKRDGELQTDKNGRGCKYGLPSMF